jgi:sortase A
MNARLRLLRSTERACWACGLAGLAWWGVHHAGVMLSTGRDLARFDAFRVVAQQTATPDQSLWSPERVSAWRKALLEPAPPPLAVLRIPKIRLEVAVMPGTDDRTLDRAVGHIEGTAQPGTDGNFAVAGHRDGFFRGLKDIAPGDVIEVDTMHGEAIYHVDRIWVVDPEDVWVLDPTPTRTLTLVTCYPFYFVGPAPRRLIVRAVRAIDERESASTGRLSRRFTRLSLRRGDGL